MPALEALQDRLRQVRTPPLGVSVDSVHCHTNWAVSLGGISFPLLADFHPKGAVAKAFGAYVDEDGTADRATVIYDADGIVHYAASVTPAGERDIGELVIACEQMAERYSGSLESTPRPAGVPDGTTLYVKSRCGFSLRALNALANCHLQGRVAVRNVSSEPAALGELRELTGAEQAPCLVAQGKPLLESKDIVRYLADRATGLGV